MEGEDACFLVVFIDLERHMPFAYIPLKKGSKSCSSPQKFLLVSWVIFNDFFEKKGFKKEIRGLKA